MIETKNREKEKKRKTNSDNNHRQKYDTFSFSDASSIAKKFLFFALHCFFFCAVISLLFSASFFCQWLTLIICWYVCHL